MSLYMSSFLMLYTFDRMTWIEFNVLIEFSGTKRPLLFFLSTIFTIFSPEIFYCFDAKRWQQAFSFMVRRLVLSYRIDKLYITQNKWHSFLNSCNMHILIGIENTRYFFPHESELPTGCRLLEKQLLRLRCNVRGSVYEQPGWAGKTIYQTQSGSAKLP